MAGQEEIQAQLTLLKTHRKTLEVYLRQQAQMGFSVSPHVIHGITDAREQISRIKAALRQLGVTVDDHPNDNELAAHTKEASSSLDMSKRINPQVIVAIITATVAIIVAIIGIIKPISVAFPGSVNSFQYQIRVQARSTGDNIYNAKVTIEMADSAPLDIFTDNNGYARITVDAKRAGKPARMIVEAKGYKHYEQAIDLVQDSLPDIIKLEAVS